jgi:hypothetical protein
MEQAKPPLFGKLQWALQKIKIIISLLAGQLKPTTTETEIPELSISYKPQKIAPKFEGTVRQLLMRKIPSMLNHPAFKTDVLNPLNIENIIDFEVHYIYLCNAINKYRFKIFLVVSFNELVSTVIQRWHFPIVWFIKTKKFP